MKASRTKYTTAANVISFLLLAGMFLYLALNWNSIPDQVPTHFNAVGQADKWGGKRTLFLLPIIGCVLYGSLSFVECLPVTWNTGKTLTPENKLKVCRAVKNMLVTVKLICMGFYAFITILSALCKNLGTASTFLFMLFIIGDVVYTICLLIKYS